MSLNVDKLEKVRTLANGTTQARCPACAENDQDRSGEHLRIYPDGRFGCCVYPKDKEHRRRIFALAGSRTTRPMRVRVASGAPAATPSKSIAESLKGFLGTVGTGKSESKSSEENTGTLGTPKNESVSSYPSSREGLESKLGTDGTGNFNPRAYAREAVMHTHDITHTCKDWTRGDPSVPSGEGSERPPNDAEKQERLPFITPGGSLSIPFDSPERYHWWKLDGERMSVDEIHAEALQRMAEQKGKESYGDGI